MTPRLQTNISVSFFLSLAQLQIERCYVTILTCPFLVVNFFNFVGECLFCDPLIHCIITTRIRSLWENNVFQSCLSAILSVQREYSPYVNCLNLFTWVPHRSCWQAGGWPSIERPSCSLQNYRKRLLLYFHTTLTPCCHKINLYLFSSIVSNFRKIMLKLKQQERNKYKEWKVTIKTYFAKTSIVCTGNSKVVASWK